MKFWYLKFRHTKYSTILPASLLAASSLVTGSSPAFAMDAQIFYVKALALKKQGATAVLSNDLKPLVKEMRTAGKSIKAENERATKAGKPLFCKANRKNMGPEELLRDWGRIPKAKRSRMSVRQALRKIVIRRYPC